MFKQKTSVTGGLIPLPRDYTDLMNLAAAFTCPNNVSGPSAGEVGRKFFNSKWSSSFSKMNSILFQRWKVRHCASSAEWWSAARARAVRLSSMGENTFLWGCALCTNLYVKSYEDVLAALWIVHSPKYDICLRCIVVKRTWCKYQISNMLMDVTKSRMNCKVFVRLNGVKRNSLCLRQHWE